MGEVTSLTLFEDFLYWSDQKRRTLNRAHKTSGERRVELLSSWQTIRDIKIYHPLRQPDGKNTLRVFNSFIYLYRFFMTAVGSQILPALLIDDLSTFISILKTL